MTSNAPRFFPFLDVKFQGEAVSDYRRRPESWRIKFKMKSNNIKMYDKFSNLRIEMTINDPREFKVFKDVQHKDGTISKRWVPMGKSIANLYRYAEISKAANKRSLDSLQNIIPVKSLEKEIDKICSRKTVNGKTITGFNVWEPDTFQLFETISQGKYLIKGFTNQDIRAELFSKETDAKKQSGKTGRLLRKLREHGIIKKVPHSQRYLLTSKGRRITGALIEKKRKIYPELVAIG